MTIRVLTAAMLALGLAAGGAHAQSAAGTIGSGGSAAAGGTSASTLGLGATQTSPSGTTSSLGTSGSAAAAEGKATSRSKVNGNRNTLMGHSKAMAHDKGTFSKSQTKTQIHAGDSLRTRTKTMSHVPGEKPVKSTTRNSVDLNQ